MLIFHRKQNVMEDEILNKKIKYMGIAAATLLTVAPIATPVFNSATEITAKADTVNDSVKAGTSATDTKTDDVTDTNTSTDTESSTSTDTKADTDNSTSVDTKANTDDSTNTVVNATATATTSDEKATDSKTTTSNQTVYKVDNVDYDEGGYNSGVISGSLPAMKDGKEIEITYRVEFDGNSNGDVYGNNEKAIMPYFEGYSVNQEFVTFGIQRDPNTNEVTGITLPNGIPVYTKNGKETSTTPESNEIVDVSPMFPNSEGQEKLSNSTDITPKQKADGQKWESQMKSSFRLTKDMSLITNDDGTMFYIHGSDGWLYFGAKNLTPQSDVFEYFSSDDHNKDEFFMNFNDNKDRSDLFFDNEHYIVFATATANDGSVKRNLFPSEVNQFLEEKGGKGVTFHFGVHYAANLENDNASTDDNEHNASGGFDSDRFLKDNSKQVASKDVVVLPPDADSSNTTNTGSNTNTGNTANTGSNTNTSTSTTTDENKNNDKTTTPATSYSSVYTPTTGTQLYNDNGTLITNVSLGKNTAWKVDQKKVVKGVTYLRVATNEWVKVDNGLEIKLIDSVITTNKQTTLYNSKGEKITNRVLGADTAWRTDRTAQINGQTMYRVATNEWVSASNVQ
ncbi:hypothetical protein FC78_GL001631 [Companilactobacillus bobalius DSM 19674]|uniref:S-layer protein C-terminal domain-containing protein n=1 Tax=Companilactobacillus bobalius DSM 19674 TaxID=1423788 RepID=A0A0R1KHG4_9LACO|nr:hypothetical protein FC78_GL001631 [Companilactobacillus bobalius DSM 19674]